VKEADRKSLVGPNEVGFAKDYSHRCPKKAIARCGTFSTKQRTPAVKAKGFPPIRLQNLDEERNRSVIVVNDEGDEFQLRHLPVS
jgi:hypothetical protein